MCDRGLRRYPTYAGARMTLARALAEHGELARAEAEFRHVLELTSDSVPAHRALGDLLRGQGRTAEALVVYEALQELTPLDEEVGPLLETLRASLAPAAAPAPASPATQRGIPAEAALDVPVFDLTEAAAAPDRPLAPPIGGPQAEAIAPPPALATETLADLYAQQGFVEDARAIYRELVRVEPARADLRAKLASLGAAPSPGGVADEADSEFEPVAPPRRSATGRADPLEALEAWLEAARELRAERGRR